MGSHYMRAVAQTLTGGHLLSPYQNSGPWLNLWPMVKPLAHGQTSGPWSNLWPMAQPLAHGQTSGPWSNLWPMVKPLAHGQTSGPWSNLWPYPSIMKHCIHKLGPTGSRTLPIHSLKGASDDVIYQSIN